MTDNEEIIRDFIAAWSRLDAGELASYFTVDGIYHNMPGDPVVGRANIEKFIAAFIAPWTETNWEILNILIDGEVVMAERIDRTKLGERAVDLPCLGVFEMADGKISAWRDYFDMRTYTKAVS